MTKILRTTPNFFDAAFFCPDATAAYRADGSRQHVQKAKKPRRTYVFRLTGTKKEPPGYLWKPQQRGGGRYPDGPCCHYSAGPSGRQEAERANAPLGGAKTALPTNKSGRKSVPDRYRPVFKRRAAHTKTAEKGAEQFYNLEQPCRIGRIADSMRGLGEASHHKMTIFNSTEN